MPESHLNYIDGRWVPASEGETFLDTNPARPDEVIGEFQRSGPTDVDAAVTEPRTSGDAPRLPSGGRSSPGPPGCWSNASPS
jgi:aldehyde dehydrogenase (NAD+)